MINNNKFPCLNAREVCINKIMPNDYNPNKVARPELKLLELSIINDGYTMPIVCYYDKENDFYIIIDGFHRYQVGLKLGYKTLPVTIIEKDLKERYASTIRHNRARGKHEVISMVEIVKDLWLLGWNDYQIAKELGMDADEVLRLKQASGISSIFKDHNFNDAWE